MYPGDKNGTNALRPSWYSVMDSHFDANHFDAFHKLKSGFVTPNVIEANGWSTHTVALAAVETRQEVTILYDPARQDKEYFILENRWGGTGNANYDGTLPSQGIVIWHVVQDPTTMNQFPPPYTGQLPGSGDWGRLAVRRIAVLSASGQTKDLTYADGSPAHFRITAKSGPQEFVNTEIARI
jgi:hypothetical protein